MLDFDKVRELLLEHIAREFNSVIIDFARHHNFPRFAIDHIIHNDPRIHRMSLHTLYRILDAANIALEVVRK